MSNATLNGRGVEPESVSLFPSLDEQARLLKEVEPESVSLFPSLDEQARLLKEAAHKAAAQQEASQTATKQIANTTSDIPKDLDAALGGYDCDWLMKQDLPETQFVVQGILPVGYSVLGGRPKQGKSISVLGSLALPVASGKKGFGIHDVQQGTVLMLAYEDTKRRLKERLERFTQYNPYKPDLSQLRAYHNFPRAHEQGLDLLEALLDKYTNTTFVVIDTLPRFAPPRAQGQNEYDSEYNLGASLFKLAHERQIAILSIVHTTKSSYSNVFDNLRGSGGTAAADVLMVLERTNDKLTRILHCVGRDTEEQRLELQSDSQTLLYRNCGECEDERYAELTNFDFKASISESESKKAKAVELLQQGTSLQEIADTLGVGKTTVHRWTKAV
jgi:RecA-family ATPase